MNKWFALVVLFLLVLGLVVWENGPLLRRSELGNVATLALRNTHPPEIYLSGPFRLTLSSSAVLGWETEEIKPSSIIRMVNEERQKAGVPALEESPNLTEAARMRVGTIFKNQNFSHEDPVDGIQLSTVLPRVNYYFSYA